MDLSLFTRKSEYEWEIAPHGAMRVPAVIYASEQLIRDMDQKVYEQACNVAQLPGIVKASYAMPDAHWGYGFPIGGVAAFDPDEGGVISAGGVGYDVSCGVRCLHTGLTPDDILPVQKALAEGGRPGGGRRASRGGRRDAAPHARRCLGARQETSARRDGYARERQPLSRGTEGRADPRRPDRRGLRAA